MALTEGQLRYYAGDYNTISQDWQTDGSVIMTLWREGDAQAVRMRVRDLHGPAETVVKHEHVDHGPPVHVRSRQEEAQQWLADRTAAAVSALPSIQEPFSHSSAPAAPALPLPSSAPSSPPEQGGTP